jgi:hypothetical protein
MYAECRHVFASGRKCTHPQLHDSHFCYFHRNAHEIMHAPAARPGTPFRLPLLEDSSALLMAIQQVTSSLGAKTITQKEAGTYLYAINIAKGLLPRRPAMTRKPVRSLCYDNDGFELAEPVNTCEPPATASIARKPAPAPGLNTSKTKWKNLSSRWTKKKRKRELPSRPKTPMPIPQRTMHSRHPPRNPNPGPASTITNALRSGLCLKSSKPKTTPKSRPWKNSTPKSNPPRV